MHCREGSALGNSPLRALRQQHFCGTQRERERERGDGVIQFSSATSIHEILKSLQVLTIFFAHLCLLEGR